VSVAHEAVLAGVSTVQFCWNGSDKDAVEILKTLRYITNSNNATLIINNRLDLAIAVDADGLHLGQTDIPVSDIVKHIPKNMKLGLTVSTELELRNSLNLPVDYYGVGPVYASKTKPSERIVGLNGLKDLRSITTKPIVAIGGITEQNVGAVIANGANEIAVIGAIYNSANIANTVKNLLSNV
jgi:thiamine-phosphate diphosphorylase